MTAHDGDVGAKCPRGPFGTIPGAGGYVGDRVGYGASGIRDRHTALPHLYRLAQPSGIRVEDGLAWAREIVRRYEGLGSTSNSVQTSGD